jgi:hypothetical protein
MLRTLFLLFLIPGLVGAQQQSDPPVPTKDEIARATIVKLEDLTAHPERYDKTLVRVNASWVDGIHASYLCSVDDPDNDTHCIGVYFACPDEDARKEMTRKLNTLLPAHRFEPYSIETRGVLSLVGRFKDTKPPPPTNSPRFFLEVWEIVGALPKKSP